MSPWDGLWGILQWLLAGMLLLVAVAVCGGIVYGVVNGVRSWFKQD